MSQVEQYDTLVLGSGEAGKYLAWHLASTGQRVAVIERRYVGGSCRDNLAGGNHVTTGRQVPYCLFTDPEFARVGLNEREAAEQGIRYRLAKLPVAAILRARTLSEERGFLKALVAADGDRLLGFAAFGPETGELLAPVQIVMSAGLPYTVLRDAVITHPTMSEAFGPLFANMSTPS